MTFNPKNRILESGAVTVLDRKFEVFGYSDDTLFCDIRNRGSWHEFDLPYIGEMIASDDVCFDLGANIGMATLALATLVPKGHVYAFEASPETALALQKTVQKNALSNVTVANAVVGRGSETVKFFDIPEVRTSGHYVPADTPRKVAPFPQQAFQVVMANTKSVDQLVDEYKLGRLDVIKIDVEGAELDVLQGATETLNRFSPLVLMEFNSYALMHYREIPPRRALEQIFEVFDEIFFFKGRTGKITRLDNTEESREAFLHHNLFNGFVDDLLCVLARSKIKRSGLLSKVEQIAKSSSNEQEATADQLQSISADQFTVREYTYEGRGQTSQTIPSDLQKARREQGASILGLSPEQVRQPVLQLHCEINCYTAEPNSAVVAVFQDGVERAVGLVVQELKAGKITVFDRDISINIDPAVSPPVLDVRVGLLNPGTLSLNHDPLLNIDAPSPSRVQLKWVQKELGQESDELHGSTQRALQEARDEILRLKVQNEQAADYQLLMDHQAKLVGFSDTEPEFMELYEKVKPYSMGSIERLYALFKAIEYIVKAGIPGDIVECGVWRGGSMMMAALSLMAFGDTSRGLRLFDTFEGHPRPDPEKDGLEHYREWESRRPTLESSDWARVSIEEVSRNMESTGYPRARISLVKGTVEKTLPGAAPDEIALLRLDTDWYESTLHELNFLYPRLSARGVLIIDDYGAMRGARRAVDEYFESQKKALLFHRIDFTGRIALKV